MKPPEILSLLEEAAGTRMYEKKKDAAIRTLDKKQSRLDQIDAVRGGLPALHTLRACHDGTVACVVAPLLHSSTRVVWCMLVFWHHDGTGACVVALVGLAFHRLVVAPQPGWYGACLCWGIVLGSCLPQDVWLTHLVYQSQGAGALPLCQLWLQEPLLLDWWAAVLM